MSKVIVALPEASVVKAYDLISVLDGLAKTLSAPVAIFETLPSKEESVMVRWYVVGPVTVTVVD